MGTEKKQCVKILLWGTEIGQIFWEESRQNSYFFFSPDYFRQPYDISPILYPKDSPESRWAIYGEKEDKIYQCLPPFIADSLPDRWGNAIFDEWFKDMHYKERDKNPLTKLSFIGDTAMGALEFVPMLNKGRKPGKIDIRALYREAKKFEAKLAGETVQIDDKVQVKALAALGTSPGGSRSKAIVSRMPDGTFVSGKTATSPLYKHYILKFNDPQYSISETEMTYRQLAIQAGIDMMPSQLFTIGGQKHFMTERFDRKDGEKVFMQTFAALNQCDQSYEELFRTCRILNLDMPQMEEMFRRMAFNILMNNTDDHRKNFSFLMSKNGRWSMAPHYDCTFILENGNTPSRTHCMSLGGRHSDLGTDDLLAFAEKNGIRNAAAIIDSITAASLNFRELARTNGVRPDIAEIIEERLKELRPRGLNKINAVRNVSFKTGNGTLVEKARFERAEKGNFHLVAIVGGIEKKYVFTPRRQEYSQILEAGFNEMPLPEIKKLVTEFLLGEKRSTVKPIIPGPANSNCPKR